MGREFAYLYEKFCFTCSSPLLTVGSDSKNQSGVSMKSGKVSVLKRETSMELSVTKYCIYYILRFSKKY